MPLITYLPYPSFAKTAQTLHDDELQIARQSAHQILTKQADPNHPCSRMWEGHEYWLLDYALVMCGEWMARGHEDTLIDEIATLQKKFKPIPSPWWSYLPAIGRTHQMSLLSRRRSWYLAFFGDLKFTSAKYDYRPMPLGGHEPIFWPVGPKSVMQPF